MADPIPEAYADCIHVRCCGCRADPDHYCINKITKLPRGTPCVVRMRDADQPLENQTSTKDF